MLIQEDYFKNIFNTVRGAILILDENLRVLSANRSFFTIFKVDAANTIGTHLYDLGNGQWDIPYLRVLLEDVLPKNDTVDDYEIVHDFESIGRKTMLLNACKVREKLEEQPIILLAIEDITEHKRLEELLTESEKRYRRIFETASDGIVLLEKNAGNIADVNPSAVEMMGYSEAECIGKSLQDIGISVDMNDFQAIMQSLNRHGIINYDDVPVRTKDGQDIYTDIYLVDRATLAQCNIRDVTERKKAEEKLKEEKTFIENALSSLHDVFFVFDPEGGFLRWNKALNAVTGYIDTEIALMKATDFFRNEDITRVSMAIREVVKTGSASIEASLVTKGGVQIPYEFRVSLQRDHTGKLIGICGVGSDITERKLLDAALLASEIRYRSIFENSVMGVSQTLPDGRLINANQSYAEMYGYANAAEMISEAPDVGQRYANPDDRQEVLRILNEKGVMAPREITVVRRDGTRFGVLVAARELRDSAGNLLCYQAEHVDVTERIRAEEALRQSENKFRILFENAADSILLLEIPPEGIPVIRNVNNSTLRIHGYERDELIGQPVAFLDSQPDASKAVEKRWQEIKVGTGNIFQLEHRCKDGSIREFECSISEMQIGSKTFAISVERDITERKRFEIERKTLFNWKEGVNHLEQSLLAPATLNQKLKCITDGIVQIFAADFCRIWLIRPGDLCDKGCIHAQAQEGPHVCRYRDRCLHLLSSSGRYTHTDGKGHCRVPFNCYKIGRIASGEEHKSLLNDVQNDPRIHDQKWAYDLGLVSFAGYQLHIPDGQTIGVMALFAKHPITVDEDAMLDGLSSTVALIVQEAAANDALRENAIFLDTLLASLPIPVFYKDSKFRYIGMNKAYETLIGSTRDQLLGKSVFDIAPRELAECYHAKDLELLQDQVTQVYESQVKDMHGAMHDVIFHKAIFMDSGGHALGLIGAILDITERKRAEEAQARLVMAVEQAAETIVITDTEGKILYVNPAFEKITGYSRAEVDGQNPRVLKSGKHDGEFYRQMWLTLTAGETWKGHLINKRKDGTFYEEEAAISPVCDAAGKVINYVAVKYDVTNVVKLEVQLQQAQKMEAVGRLAGGVAHDFNNMLGVILGHAELALMRPDLSPKLIIDLEEIRKAAERSANLTRQLLAFARKQTIAPKVLDLNEAVTGMLKMLQRLIGEDINLVWQSAANLWQVKMDPSQIDQILANLCVNARDSIADVGKITIETENFSFDEEFSIAHTGAIPGDYVRLAVSDNGCGMDKEMQLNIFEPFFTTKEMGKGTGLGLATVYGIVKQNHGFIDIYSEPGQGTTFKIYLPSYRFQADQLKVEGGEIPVPCGSETILLVEDEPPILELTKSVLENLGYTVLQSSTPGEAISLAQEHAGEIDLLMTDVVMPEMNGRDLAKNLLSLYPGLKSLFMSGYTSDVIARHGVLDEGVNFIQKPFSIQSLSSKLREVLDTGKIPIVLHQGVTNENDKTHSCHQQDEPVQS